MYPKTGVLAFNQKFTLQNFHLLFSVKKLTDLQWSLWSCMDPSNLRRFRVAMALVSVNRSHTPTDTSSSLPVCSLVPICFHPLVTVDTFHRSNWKPTPTASNTYHRYLSEYILLTAIERKQPTCPSTPVYEAEPTSSASTPLQQDAALAWEAPVHSSGWMPCYKEHITVFSEVSCHSQQASIEFCRFRTQYGRPLQHTCMQSRTWFASACHDHNLK